MVFASVPFPVVRDLCRRASNVRLTFDENMIICDLRSADAAVVSLHFDLNSIGNAGAKKDCVHLRSL